MLVIIYIMYRSQDFYIIPKILERLEKLWKIIRDLFTAVEKHHINYNSFIVIIP